MHGTIIIDQQLTRPRFCSHHREDKVLPLCSISPSSAENVPRLKWCKSLYNQLLFYPQIKNNKKDNFKSFTDYMQIVLYVLKQEKNLTS